MGATSDLQPQNQKNLCGPLPRIQAWLAVGVCCAPCLCIVPEGLSPTEQKDPHPPGPAQKTEAPQGPAYPHWPLQGCSPVQGLPRSVSGLSAGSKPETPGDAVPLLLLRTPEETWGAGRPWAQWTEGQQGSNSLRRLPAWPFPEALSLGQRHRDGDSKAGRETPTHSAVGWAWDWDRQPWSSRIRTQDANC